MEKQFNTVQVQHWVNCGLSLEDAQYLATIQLTHEIRLERQEEYESPRGQFDDDKVLKWVQKQIREGNEWGWFCARVVVSESFPSERFEDEYLGCCSYKDRNDFICGGYFVDMVKEAYERLVKQPVTA